jgi:biopolymer transport protein ExbD
MATGMFGKKAKGLFDDPSEADEIVNPYSGESRPTAIIDIVFLLLIFFMCSSSFPLLERRLDAQLPKDKGWRPKTSTDVIQAEDIVIEVTAVSYKEMYTPKFKIMGWISSDTTALASQLGQLRSALKGDNPRVVIAGKPDCPFMHVMTALDACARANLTNVEFRPPLAAGGGGSDSDYSQL